MLQRFSRFLLALLLVGAVVAAVPTAHASGPEPVSVSFNFSYAGGFSSSSSFSPIDLSHYSLSSISGIGYMVSSTNYAVLAPQTAFTLGASSPFVSSSKKPYVSNILSDYRPDGETYDVLIPAGSAGSFRYTSPIQSCAFVTSDDKNIKFGSASAFSVSIVCYTFDGSSWVPVLTFPTFSPSLNTYRILTFDALDYDIQRVDVIHYIKAPSSATVCAPAFRVSSGSTSSFNFLSASYALAGLSNQLNELNDTSKGIFSTLGNILSNLLQFFTNILGLVQDFFDFVVTIPDLIIDGIKNLFIPSAEDLASISDGLSSLMSEKLGVLWEFGDFFVSFFAIFHNPSSNGMFTFPGISISFGKGAVFTIPSYTSSIFPPQLSALQEICQAFVNFSFAFALWVGVQRYFDRIMDGGGGSE